MQHGIIFLVCLSHTVRCAMSHRGSSHILVEYLNARLAGAEARKSQEPRKVHSESSLAGQEGTLDFVQRSSGLDTLQDMEHALPPAKT